MDYRSERKIIRGIGVLFLGIFSFLKIEAQDIHFSQFYFSPLAINPANTGIFSGNYRLSTNYKNQWRSISNPYKSSLASFDMPLAKRKLGLGISFFTDKAGKSMMGLTLGNLSVSYNLKLNQNHNFITGLQYGFGQRSIKTEDLKWDSQYNGSVYDPGLPSGETQWSQSYSYMDVSAGVLWNYSAKVSKFKSSTGLALFHANQPKESFYTDDKLDDKVVVHNSSQIKLPDKPAYILPQFLFLKQGPHSELNIGCQYKYVFSPIKSIFRTKNRIDIGAKIEDKAESRNSLALFAGGQLRWKDAFIVMFGFELKKSLLISFAYDVNVSKLRVASSSKGGMELALTYKGYF